MPAIVADLQVFSQVSGLKIHLQKSQVLNQTATQMPGKALRAQFDFDRVTDGITYLGLVLHKSLAKTAEVNNNTLLSRI